METLAEPKTAATAQGWQTVEAVKRLLCALGADADLLRRVVLRADSGGRQYVSVPPLPADLAKRLVQSRPEAVTSC